MNEIKPGLTYRPWARIGEINQGKKHSNGRQKRKRDDAIKKESTESDHKIDEFA